MSPELQGGAERLHSMLHDALAERLASEGLTTLFTHLIVLAAVVLLCVAANFVAQRIILRAVKAIIRRTETDWDDVILEHHVFDRLSHLAPAVILFSASGLIFPDSPTLAGLTEKVAQAYMLVMLAVVIDHFLDAVVAIYRRYEVSRTRPIKSYVQVVKVVAYVFVGILVISVLTSRSPWVLLSGLGALTAVLLLVFKDTILGLVASIQLTANDMVQRGDWIEMPKFGADGDVLEVTLNTVKVQNWDKTISTIPTYALMSETFKNWRGMQDSGGRRIKRALYIDMTSVKFCSEAMLQRFEKFAALSEYIRNKQREVAEFNSALDADMSVAANGRRLTNLGTFRAYVVAYLRRHPKIHQHMTFLVRQLAPGPNGIGIEIYVFSNDQVWAHYEDIQSDIFDHLLAVLPDFELRVFQNPSGADFRKLAG